MRRRVVKLDENVAARPLPARSVAAVEMSNMNKVAAIVGLVPDAYGRGLLGVMVKIVPAAFQLKATCAVGSLAEL